jgi:hypothetical protein
LRYSGLMAAKPATVAHPPRVHAPSLTQMAIGSAVAIGATVLLIAIAGRYPIPLAWKLAPLVCYAILLCWKPEAWLLVVPLVLPVLDLAPWTGWIFVDAFDFIVLTTVAVGYLRLSGRPPTLRLPRTGWLLLGMFVLSLLMSTWRGLGSAGLPPFDANALCNYASPYNALHVAKGFAWAMLLAPLLTRTAGHEGENLRRYFFPGILCGLVCVCVLAIWERAAFPGLMNFSADYRTTAGFSAMHTGGAALDGFLALTVPMLALPLLPGRSLAVNAVGLLLLAASVYVLATTFSRGLYAGFGLSVLVLVAGLARSSRSAPRQNYRHTVLKVVLAALVVWMLYRLFGSGGYRALAAALVLLLGVFYVGAQAQVARTGWLWPTIALGLLTASIAFAWLVPKGAYVVFAIAAVSLTTLAAIHAAARGSRLRLPQWLLIAIAWVATGLLLVALHWGGVRAMVDALWLVAVALLAGVVNRRMGNPLWYFSKRGTTLALALAVALGLGVPVIGNYYAQTRFARVEGDLKGRFAHWADVLAIMRHDAPTLLFGTGMGRFYSEYFWRNNRNETPGSFQYSDVAGNQFLRLAGPRYPIGYGEVLRFGQRVSVIPGEHYRLHFFYRTNARDALLESYLCEKLLLYFRNCSVKNIVLRDADGGWHEASAELLSGTMGSEPWYLQRPIQFSVANPGAAVAIDLDNLRLIDSAGNDILKNGNFARGGDFWFYSSDRYHLPWHAKNLFLNVYFDQGLFGLTTLALLVSYALIRLIRRAVSGNQDSVVILASIAGFLVVGMFDSLLDVPRIATLFFLVLCIALQRVGRKPVRSA